MIRFKVTAQQLHQHIFDIELRMENPGHEQVFMLPNWIAGSYKIRDFAKHISSIQCLSGVVQKISKNRFLATTTEDKLILSYQSVCF